jgi:hypothetical protein
MSRTDTAVRVISASPDRALATLTDSDALAVATARRMTGQVEHFDALAMLTTAVELDLPLDDVVRALAVQPGPPGRMQIVPVDRPYTVIVGSLDANWWHYPRIARSSEPSSSASLWRFLEWAAPTSAGVAAALLLAAFVPTIRDQHTPSAAESVAWSGVDATSP